LAGDSAGSLSHHCGNDRLHYGSLRDNKTLSYEQEKHHCMDNRAGNSRGDVLHIIKIYRMNGSNRKNDKWFELAVWILAAAGVFILGWLATELIEIMKRK
jgi:predicted NACHT family NTPase